MQRLEMQFKNKLSTPGEHALFLPGKSGQLEAMLLVPAEIQSSKVAILGHPHSLQGGTMNNKVVTTMARAFKELGIPSLRFNFRGVGLSQGVFDEGIGESEDMHALVTLWQQELGGSFIFAGFSFGSYVAYRTASQLANSSLLTIAPPVHHYDYKAFSSLPRPWFIIQGDSDEVVPANLVYDFAETVSPKLPIVRMETGHFFHGKLVELKTELLQLLQNHYL